MKRLVLTLAATGAVALAAPAGASAAASDPPNCFGQGAAALAASGPGAVGTFASGAAQTFKGPNNGSIGQTGVPLLKATCVPE
jgi:hypothetical protein